MVYSNKFVISILVDGNTQQELANGTVKLPFGAEYAIRLRNKNSRRAVAKLFVDGENVSGNGYIVPANDHVDIKRHWDKDVAFKFVELDSPEAVDAGTVKLVGTDIDKIVSEANELLRNPEAYLRMSKSINPYGDGVASQRIADAILRYFELSNKEVKEFKR